MTGVKQRWWGGLDLREALFAGLCALMVVAGKNLLRLHLKIPGHAMFLTMLFLILAKGCIRKPWAGSVTALLAGLGAMVLSGGKGGPLVIISYLLPGIMLDLVGLAAGGDVCRSRWICALAGCLAAAARMPGVYIIDALAGMEADVVLWHVVGKTLAGAAFGFAGALLAYPVVRRLRGTGLAGRWD